MTEPRGVRPTWTASLTVAVLVATLRLAHAEDVCVLIVEARDGKELHRSGDCRTRVSPASTFKLPLAIMGFDSGLLQSDTAPKLLYRTGEPDWGGATWRQETSPRDWMRHSVVWYSQRLTLALGAQRLQTYCNAFSYGNADISGDPGKDNGLLRSWIGSSLRISPEEQVRFLRRLHLGELPVAPQAMDAAKHLLVVHFDNGWVIRGKTGSFITRDAAIDSVAAGTYGWYIGWAQKNGRTLLFAYLASSEPAVDRRRGLRAREDFLQRWSSVANKL